MLAVATGGTLYQDIGIEAAKRGHSRTAGHSLVNIVPPLTGYLPYTHVNSYHHQAVKTLPPGLQTVAMSPDGIVEAIWRPGMLGVQWHPELLIGSQPKWESLFRWFMEGLE